MVVRNFRRPRKSLRVPENTLGIRALDSAIPSIRPTANVLAPSTDTRNTGSRLWIISDEISANMLTKPSAQMLPGIARRPLGRGCEPLAWSIVAGALGRGYRAGGIFWFVVVFGGGKKGGERGLR